MYNDHEEQFEVEDFDEDIKRRKELLEEAKNIQESSDWNETFRQISNLKRKWKQIPYRDSAYEDELMQEFEGYLDAFYAKRKEGYQSNEVLKKELIAQAKKVAQSSDWNKATEEMNELMQQWKAIGTAGKESDDALWEEFNAARQVFFDRKHEHWADLQSKFANAKEVKQDLIKKAEALRDSEEWQKTSEAFHHLMDEWKAAGSAGREFEDALWEEFNAHRQNFYEKRSKFYDALHEEQEGKYQEKKALVEKAKEIAEQKLFSREHTAAMKKLGSDWKAIGSCGKEREDAIWKEFRTIMDGYFEGLKAFNDQKHAQWKQKMVDARARKLDLIQKQKRQIKYLEEEMVGLLGQRAIDEAQEQIKDKEEFIKELEEQLADIDQKLAE